MVNALRSSELENFFAALQSSMLPSSLADELATFFDGLQDAHHTPSSSVSADYDSMQQFLGILQAPLGTASRDGAFVDVWSVAGIGQDELRNSKILAWLLDCSGTHGQGDAFLRCLLDKIWERLPVGFPQASDLDSGYRTRLETYPLGNSDSRVDIDIDGAKFVLFIEVKVNASERPDQVARYRRLAHEAANGRNFGVLFLSRSLIGLDLSETEQVVAITWHDVAASVSKHLSDKAATEGDKFLRTLLSQLVQHFSKFK